MGVTRYSTHTVVVSEDDLLLLRVAAAELLEDDPVRDDGEGLVRPVPGVQAVQLAFVRVRPVPLRRSHAHLTLVLRGPHLPHGLQRQCLGYIVGTRSHYSDGLMFPHIADQMTLLRNGLNVLSLGRKGGGGSYRSFFAMRCVKIRYELMVSKLRFFPHYREK